MPLDAPAGFLSRQTFRPGKEIATESHRARSAPLPGNHAVLGLVDQTFGWRFDVTAATVFSCHIVRIGWTLFGGGIAVGFSRVGVVADRYPVLVLPVTKHLSHLGDPPSSGSVQRT